MKFQGTGYVWADGEPTVDLNSRDSIIGWMVWNSHGNACVTDKDSDVEGLPRLTLETARETLIEAYYQSTGETIEL